MSQFTFDTTATLAEVREQFSANQDSVKRCPCCDKPSGHQRKNFSKGMAISLRHLYREGDGWVKPSRDLSHNTSSWAAGLRHWGLIESLVPVSKARGKDTGYYRITDKGRQFVEGLITLPSYVILTRQQEVVGFAGEEVSLTAILAE
jgi:hypothetical protein